MQRLLLKNNQEKKSFDPISLTVYQSPYTKIRLGKEYDGGYVISEIPDNYKIILSGGISKDISFEEDFLKKFPNSTCYAFDGTIEKLPKESQNVNFIKKNIGYKNTDNITNLHELINKNDSIFIKMDIEGSEIEWLDSLNKEQMNKFNQIVMEFHRPFGEKERNTFNKLNKTHVLVHFHGNNCRGLRDHKGCQIPNIFECTYLHKKYFSSDPQLNKDTIPSIIDMRNVEHKEEISINYPPFVN